MANPESNEDKSYNYDFIDTYLSELRALPSHEERIKYLKNEIMSIKFDKGLEEQVLANVNALLEHNQQNELAIEHAVIIVRSMQRILAQQQASAKNEVLQGGHVIIEDNGAFYDMLKDHRLLAERISSHHKNNKVVSDASFGAGEVFRELLIGKKMGPNGPETWFQLEAHSLHGFKNFLAHILDFILYKWHGKNVGQYGYSAHHDQNAIKVTLPAEDKYGNPVPPREVSSQQTKSESKEPSLTTHEGHRDKVTAYTEKTSTRVKLPDFPPGVGKKRKIDDPRKASNDPGIEAVDPAAIRTNRARR